MENGDFNAGWSESFTLSDRGEKDLHVISIDGSAPLLSAPVTIPPTRPARVPLPEPAGS